MGIRTGLFASICLLLVSWSYVYYWDDMPSLDDVQENIIKVVNRLTQTSQWSTHLLPASVDVDLTKPDRSLENLTSETQALALEFLEVTKEAGYHLFITEWLRSPERHRALYDQGRTRPGPIVTWTTNSRHIKGIAFDVAFEPAYHGSAYPNNPTIWEEIGEIWESLWLIRWGRWRNPDMPHFQNGW